MNSDLAGLTGLLAVVWFLVYWVFGGVGFALVLIWRLGRVRKVRFGCLFTLLALASAICASWYGVRYSHDAVAHCLANATNRAQVITAIFGCGFVGIVGTFAIGVFAITFGGFLLMFICRRRKPSTPTVGGEDMAPSPTAQPNSKFF